MTRRQLLLTHASLLLVAIVWGATFVSVRYLLRTLAPTSVLLLRVELAAACFGLLLLATRRSLPRFSGAVWRRLLLIAVCGVLAHNLAITYSQHYITAGLASLLSATNPVFTAGFSVLLLGETLTRRKLGGIGIAFARLSDGAGAGQRRPARLGRQPAWRRDSAGLADWLGTLHRAGETADRPLPAADVIAGVTSVLGGPCSCRWSPSTRTCSPPLPD